VPADEGSVHKPEEADAKMSSPRST
jgi:hypothetical protein